MTGWSFKPQEYRLHATQIRHCESFWRSDLMCKIHPGALGVLVYISPASGQPLAFRSNTRTTEKTALRSNKTIQVPNPDGSTKTITCNYFDELQDPDGHDFIGAESANNLHMLLTKVVEADDLKHLEEPSSNLDYATECLQSWMHVNYKDGEKVYGSLIQFLDYC